MTESAAHSGTVRIPEFSIGDRLRKARELTGLDQTQFAAEIDLSRQTVSNYELGNVKPRRIALRAWSVRTGVPLEWLETGRYTQQGPRPGGPDGGLTEECAIRDSNPEPAGWARVVPLPVAGRMPSQPLERAS